MNYLELRKHGIELTQKRFGWRAIRNGRVIAFGPNYSDVFMIATEILTKELIKKEDERNNKKCS